MDRRPFQEFAGRLRALADAVENPRTTITELAHAAHACGLTLRLEFIDSGQRDEIERSEEIRRRSFVTPPAARAQRPRQALGPS